jgi:hypothetical protein
LTRTKAMREPKSSLKATDLVAMVTRYIDEFPDLTTETMAQYIRQADRDSPHYDPLMIAEIRDDPDFLGFLFDIRMHSEGGRFAMLAEGAIYDLPAPEGPELKAVLQKIIKTGGKRASALRLLAPHWF